MSKPVVVTIPHNLGREEAARRLREGLAGVEARFAGIFRSRAALDRRPSRLPRRRHQARMSAACSMSGPDTITLSVELPWALAVLAEKAKGLIARQGHLMLEKK